MPGNEMHFHGTNIPPDAIEFGAAMDRWQRQHGRLASWADVLAVARELGYRRLTHHDTPDDCDTEAPIMETMIPVPSGCWPEEKDIGGEA